MHWCACSRWWYRGRWQWNNEDSQCSYHKVLWIEWVSEPSAAWPFRSQWGSSPARPPGFPFPCSAASFNVVSVLWKFGWKRWIVQIKISIKCYKKKIAIGAIWKWSSQPPPPNHRSVLQTWRSHSPEPETENIFLRVYLDVSETRIWSIIRIRHQH